MLSWWPCPAFAMSIPVRLPRLWPGGPRVWGMRRLSIFGSTPLDLDILGWLDKLTCLEGLRRSLERVTGCRPITDQAKFLLNKVSVSWNSSKFLSHTDTHSLYVRVKNAEFDSLKTYWQPFNVHTVSLSGLNSLYKCGALTRHATFYLTVPRRNMGILIWSAGYTHFILITVLVYMLLTSVPNPVNVIIRRQTDLLIVMVRLMWSCVLSCIQQTYQAKACHFLDYQSKII